jgi:glycosyltransferase involved in cell wall biosynthesis
VLHKLATELPLAIPGTRVVTTVQDFMPQFFREALPDYAGRRLGHPAHFAYFDLVTRRCFARSDVVLTTTAAIAAEARRRFPRAAGRLATVPLGVEHPAGAAHGDDARREPGDAPLRLLYVGTVSPYKGQLNAVRGFDRLAERDPAVAARATLTFRGFVAEPAYHAAVRDAAAQSRVADRIHFAPYEPRAGSADIYAAGDALVLLSEYEGFGLPPLEAQVAGLPVLCSDIAVFREVLGDGAEFVAQRDPDAVAAGLRRLVTDPARRAALVARGRENARRFSWARTARETLAVYRGLVGAGAR